MSKNTSEMWSVVPGFYPGFVEIFGASFKISVVTHAADISLVESMNRIEDARRIVACVNACAGVDTALLEAGELDNPTMLVIQENKDLKHRCDELLAALDEISKLPSYRQDECSEMARDAIAKANVGAS